MKKIVIGITSLGFGGAEKVLVDIVNKLVDNYEITIFTLYKEGNFELQLDKRVKIISMYNNSYKEFSILKKLMISFKMVNKRNRKKIYNTYIKDKFEVEVAFLEGPITWIFSTKSKSKKIAWIHNDIEEVFGKGFKSFLKQKLNKKCYNLFRELVFVSNANLEKFKKYFPNNKVKKTVIYNYLNQEKVLEKANSLEVKLESPSFLQVSRLVNQKGVERLVNVHNKLIKAGYKFHTYVIGDGDLKEKIETLINNYNIKDTFHLLGVKENPYPYMKAADYFMLTSYYEGYPLVLLEAKALNKFIMITDTAAREVLINYQNSLIVSNNEEGIYQGIESILKKKKKENIIKEEDNSDLIEKIKEVLEG